MSPAFSRVSGWSADRHRTDRAARLRLGCERLLADDPAAELDVLREAADRMQRGLDELLDGRLPDGTPDGAASREVLEAYRLVAADAGWLRRAAEVIRGGLTAEAAVQRVAGELHDRMRQSGPIHP